MFWIHHSPVAEGSRIGRYEWTSGRSFAERVANIIGEDPGDDRLNGAFFLNGDTIDDDAEVDVLTGSSGLDLMFIGIGDIITDARKRETIFDIS